MCVYYSVSFSLINHTLFYLYNNGDVTLEKYSTHNGQAIPASKIWITGYLSYMCLTHDIGTAYIRMYFTIYCR